MYLNTESRLKGLTHDSAFVWSPRVQLVCHAPNVDFMGHDAIMLDIERGLFSERDFYILRCLYWLGVTDLSSLRYFVLAKLRKDKPSERPMDIERVTEAFLTKRMEAYARYGLIGHYRFKIDGEPVDINDERYLSSFFITYEGYLAVMGHYQLARYYTFDSELAYLSSMELFRRVAVKRCCMSLARYNEDVDVCGEFLFQFKMDPKHDKSRREKLFCSGTVRREDGSTVRLIFEPMFYQIDPLVVSAEANARRLTERLDSLRRYITDCSLSGEEVKLVIVVENIEGLKQFVNMIKGEPDFDFYKSNCFFTSDTLVVDLAHEDIDGALLKMTSEKGKIGFVGASALASTYKSPVSLIKGAPKKSKDA